MSLKKKILAGVLSGAILLTGGLMLSDVEAADNNNNTPMHHRERPHMDNDRHNGEHFGEGMHDREHPKMTDEQISDYAKKISEHYGVNQNEVATALKNDTHFGDVKHAAMLSKLSGKSFSEVLSMKSDWWQVAEKLGVSREQMDKLMQDEMSDDIAQKSKLDKSVVESLLKENYSPRDIEMAGLIANASGKNVKSIIAKRKINNSWEDIAKEYNVDLKTLMDKNRPARDKIR